MTMSKQQQRQQNNTAQTKITNKRKNSLFDCLFRPQHKRARITATSELDSNMSDKKKKGDEASAKTKKPTLDTTRKREVKERLNAEAKKDIRPLAVGTLAMMASALSNQGRFVAKCGFVLRVHSHLMLSLLAKTISSAKDPWQTTRRTKLSPQYDVHSLLFGHCLKISCICCSWGRLCVIFTNNYAQSSTGQHCKATTYPALQVSRIEAASINFIFRINSSSLVACEALC